MGVTYEEALATLTSMFGSDGVWTTDVLDEVLRAYEGHMENTVEAILFHGDRDPQLLLAKLKKNPIRPSLSAPGPAGQTINMDEELAREMSQSAISGPEAASSDTKKSSKADDDSLLPQVSLPPDFLRIPGYKDGGTMSSDEKLALMLQEEDFLKQVQNNPEFAHLAIGRGGQQSSGLAQAGYPGSSRAAVRMSNGNGKDVNIMENFSKMGEAAKRKLNLFAASFKAGSQSTNNRNTNQNKSERRGLLDDDDGDEEELLFAVSSDRRNMEMHSMDSTSKWGEKGGKAD
mmetsp:Transcript_11829/g.15433  ORF Transcript_11829/g.15433 Transcript_11829/m.15433 type:complete len:288 (+) Transcript_11829:163-1026(+)|eukprot:CAMPEP_0116064396 /NCGR_PEP_ID=MMETSP0322-20121206/9072_1 /TAXON_ID=163516 /ORGANISM="Leptocylindrus danicus var. apora, Strain B651" /LENGTH=287 /DNA_ID=CAMNT_0003550371 /DNA_START=80 /DNA_END=943 /DNA_ORIENTATION=+